MAKTERFKKVYSQGALTSMEIWVDTQTGVNYVFCQSGYAGGLTPLLDKDGKPVVPPVTEESEQRDSRLQKRESLFMSLSYRRLCKIVRCNTVFDQYHVKAADAHRHRIRRGRFVWRFYAQQGVAAFVGGKALRRPIEISIQRFVFDKSVLTHRKQK